MYPLVLSLASLAHAAPLPESIRGKTWGSAPAPAPDCTLIVASETERVTAHECPEAVGALHVTVQYVYLDKRLFRVHMTAAGASDCRELRAIALAAWGPGLPVKGAQPGPLADWVWAAGGPPSTHFAVFDWREEAAECGLTVDEGYGARAAEQAKQAARKTQAQGL